MTDPDRPADTLGMEPEEMRRLGHRIVDLVVDRHIGRADTRAIQTGEPEELLSLLGGPLPERPGDPDADIDLLVNAALAHQQMGDHPRYFARVAGPSSFAALLGDWLGTGFNTIATSWGGASGPATLELVALDWVREMLGLPAGSDGIAVSGGSQANLTAFAVARSERGHGVVYLTDQTHASLKRNLHHLGWQQDEIRIVATDLHLRLDVTDLALAISRDRNLGKRPMMVIGTAGTTNTGAVDPLPDLADLCAEEGIWLHVDGAYGAPAAVCSTGREVLVGLDRADSVVLDPHKWFFQPYDMGLCYVRHPGALERCFSMSPEYLRDVEAGSGEISFGNRGFELSRRARAVKLWLSLRCYGAERFRAGVAAGIALAEAAEAQLRAQPDLWDVVTPAQLGIVCFSHRGSDKADHARRVKAVSDSGFACLTSTELQGRSVLRLCTINPLTTEDDIAGTLQRIAAA